MPPLPPSIAAQMGERLRQSRADLLAHVHERMDGSDAEPPPIAPRAHMAERDDSATAETIGDDEARLAGHDEATLEQIDAALARLQAGGAGICRICGADIAPERLLATPTVDTCIDCQRELERQAHRGRGPSM